MPKKKDIDFNKYKDLASASKFGVKKRVNNIINLYSERKIYNIKTALNLLNELTDKRKNVDLGVQRYNEVIETHKKAEPLNLRHKRLRKEKVEKVEAQRLHNKVLGELVERKKLKSDLKIQNMFRNTLVFDIVQTESALDKQVLSFTLKPQRIGTNIYTEDVKTVLYKAYRAVAKLLPKKTPFYFYTEVDLKTSPHDELLHLSANRHVGEACSDAI